MVGPKDRIIERADGENRDDVLSSTYIELVRSDTRQTSPRSATISTMPLPELSLVDKLEAEPVELSVDELQAENNATSAYGNAFDENREQSDNGDARVNNESQSSDSDDNNAAPDGDDAKTENNEKISELSLDPLEAARARSIQSVLPLMVDRLQLDDSEEVKRLLADERQGIVRDKSGIVVEHNEAPIFGKTSQRVLSSFARSLSLEARDCAFGLIDANAEWPVGGPKLPREVDGTMPPAKYLSQIESGKVSLLSKTDFDRLPSAEEWKEIKALESWSTKANQNLRELDQEKLREIVVRRIEKDRLPKSWLNQLNEPEKVVAAWQLISTAREASRVLQSADYLKGKMKGSRETANEFAKLINGVPADMTFAREDNRTDGKIARVEFDFPRKLEPQSTEWLRFQHGINEWMRSMEPVLNEQMRAALDAQDPRNVLAWADIELPDHMVRQDPTGKTQDMIASRDNAPRDQQWHRFNLLKCRFDVRENFDEQTGNLKSVDVTKTTRYCNENLLSFWKMNLSDAPGTQAVKVENLGCDPESWRVVSDASGSNRLVKLGIWRGCVMILSLISASRD